MTHARFVSKRAELESSECAQGPETCLRALSVAKSCYNSRRDIRRNALGSHDAHGVGDHFPVPVMVTVTVPAFVPIASAADRAPFAVGTNA